MRCNLVIGFITYGKSTAKYLPYFLQSIKNQTFKDSRVICIDNTEEETNENREYIKNNFPEIDFNWAGENLGYAKAYNVMIRKAIWQGADYFLALNPDMLLESDAIGLMVSAIGSDLKLGSVSPKILKWDFDKQEKTKIIDSCGIKLLPGLRFVDIGQGEKDDNSFDNAEILGPSGAAAMYSLSALEKVKRNGEYFDELMFMYKEDCDLAYRLYLAGYSTKLVYDAIIYHDRTVSSKGEGDINSLISRKNKSRQVKKWSFLNQQIIFLKYWRLQNFQNKSSIIWYEIKMLVYAVIFEPYLIKEFMTLARIRSSIKHY